MNNVYYRVLLIDVFVAGCGLAACAGEPSHSNIVVRDCRVQVVDRAAIAAERNGVVERIAAETGETVKKGQELLILKDDVAQTRLELSKQNASSDINVRYSKAVLKAAQQEYESTLRLNEKKVATKQTLRLRELELERSQLGVEKAEFDQKVLKIQTRLASAELATYRVVAPFDGIVRQTMKRRGESVQNGEPVFELVNPERVRIEAYVERKLAARLKRGQPVRVTPQDDGKTSSPSRNGDKRVENQATDRKVFVSGKLILVDVIVQPVSGKVRIVAEVNSHNGLLPDGVKAVMEIPPSHLDETVKTAIQD